MGQSVDNTTVLIRFTRSGDADLDGRVTDNDVTVLGGTYGDPSAGQWARGDFDYDGAVTSNDYFLIDNAFLAQNHAAAAPV